MSQPEPISTPPPIQQTVMTTYGPGLIKVYVNNSSVWFEYLTQLNPPPPIQLMIDGLSYTLGPGTYTFGASSQLEIEFNFESDGFSTIQLAWYVP